MGLFSKIGKAIKKVGKGVVGAVGGAVKTAVKAVNVENITNVVSGKWGAVVKSVAGDAAKNVLGGAIKGLSSDKKSGSKPTPALTTTSVSKENPAVLPSPTATGRQMLATKSSTLGDFIKTAAGGAAVAVGTKLAGTEGANNVINSTGWNAFVTWAKTNWMLLVGGAAAVGTGIYFMLRKPKRTGFGRR